MQAESLLGAAHHHPFTLPAPEPEGAQENETAASGVTDKCRLLSTFLRFLRLAAFSRSVGLIRKAGVW